MADLPFGLLSALVGLIGGLALGLAARLGQFCTLGAIETAVYGDDQRRLRLWGIVVGVAIFGTQLAARQGLIDLPQTMYHQFAWNPLASIFGGLLFGYGMAMAGNCGFGALARLGGGDLRSFVIVLVMGIAALATISGPLAYLRVLAFPTRPAEGALPGIAQSLGAWTGQSVTMIGLAIGALVILVALSSARFRAAPAMIFWGALPGLAVVSAWWGTQWMASTGFEGTPVVAHTFAAPLGEAILYSMTASGRSLSFGVGSVVGVWIGAFAGSLIKGHFRWEACEDPRELRRQILGAALMGVGAVVAIGCSIGQGLSAFSVLAWSAPVTVLAIIAGAALGLRQLIEGFAPAE